MSGEPDYGETKDSEWVEHIIDSVETSTKLFLFLGENKEFVGSEDQHYCFY